MNAITNAANPATALQPGNPMMPQSMDQAMRLAELMSQGELVPKHLQKKPGDCLMVIEQAMRWGMSPFAVAQCTSVIQGKLMFEGKLVGAALNGSGILAGRMKYDYDGDGSKRRVVASAVLRGETEPRAVEVWLDKVKTSNGMWTSQPDQQLAYSANRIWARRFAPEVMLGVYTPEEFDEAPRERFAGTTIDVTPATVTTVTAAPNSKTKQVVEEMIGKLDSCDEQEEWLAMDAKSKTYREKLAANFPDLSATLEEAFTANMERLFPDGVIENATDTELAGVA
jgi:hypothetical protein